MKRAKAYNQHHIIVLYLHIYSICTDGGLKLTPNIFLKKHAELMMALFKGENFLVQCINYHTTAFKANGEHILLRENRKREILFYTAIYFKEMF